jgi:hypothetical protein
MCISLYLITYIYLYTDTIILTPEEMAHQSFLLNNTMQARSERTRKVYSRMTLFQSMLNDDKKDTSKSNFSTMNSSIS